MYLMLGRGALKRPGNRGAILSGLWPWSPSFGPAPPRDAARDAAILPYKFSFWGVENVHKRLIERRDDCIARGIAGGGWPEAG